MWTKLNLEQKFRCIITAMRLGGFSKFSCYKCELGNIWTWNKLLIFHTFNGLTLADYGFTYFTVVEMSQQFLHHCTVHLPNRFPIKKTSTSGISNVVMRLLGTYFCDRFLHKWVSESITNQEHPPPSQLQFFCIWKPLMTAFTRYTSPTFPLW